MHRTYYLSSLDISGLLLSLVRYVSSAFVTVILQQRSHSDGHKIIQKLRVWHPWQKLRKFVQETWTSDMLSYTSFFSCKSLLHGLHRIEHSSILRKFVQELRSMNLHQNNITQEICSSFLHNFLLQLSRPCMRGARAYSNTHVRHCNIIIITALSATHWLLSVCKLP